MINDCYINNLAKHQVSAVFHSRVIRKSVPCTHIYRALFENATFVPLGGTTPVGCHVNTESLNTVQQVSKVQRNTVKTQSPASWKCENKTPSLCFNSWPPANHQQIGQGLGQLPSLANNSPPPPPPGLKSRKLQAET